MIEQFGEKVISIATGDLVDTQHPSGEDQHEKGKEHTIDFENNTGENAVVVYRTPVLAYTNKDINTGEKLYVAKTLTPAATIVSVDEYNQEAALYDYLTPIDTSKLAEPGNPFS